VTNQYLRDKTAFFRNHAPAISRILFYGASILYFTAVSRPQLKGWSALCPLFWHPVAPFALFHLSALSDSALNLVYWGWIGALLFSMIGFLYRISAFFAFLGAFYIFGLLSCFGHVNHNASDFVLLLGTLVFAPVADELSVDAWVREKLGKKSVVREGTWIFFAARVQLLLIYMSAGVQKLIDPGIPFLRHDTMAQMFISAGKPLGLFFVQFPALCWTLGAMVLVFEATALLPLLFSRLRWVYFPFFFVFHAVSYLVLQVHFAPVMICYFFVFPGLEPVAKTSTLRRVPRGVFALLAVFAIFYIHDGYFSSETWPFGSYAMFTGTHSPNFWLVRFVRSKDGTETEGRGVFPSMISHSANRIERDWVRVWRREGIPEFHEHIAELLKLANQDGAKFSAIRVYKGWRAQPSAQIPVRKSPDRSELIERTELVYAFPIVSWAEGSK
jgi:hypothetical protein